MTLRISQAELERLQSSRSEAPETPQDRRKPRSRPTTRGPNDETAIQTAIAEALRWRGCYVERRNSGAVKTAKGGLVRLAPAGTPDLALILPGGRAGFCEVKRPGEGPTAIQLACHEELRRYGAVVVVAHSVDEALALLAPYLEAP